MPYPTASPDCAITPGGELGAALVARAEDVVREIERSAEAAGHKRRLPDEAIESGLRQPRSTGDIC